MRKSPSVALLCLTLMLLALSNQPVQADDFSINDDGEEGPEAYLSLFQGKAFQLGMVGCKKSGDERTLEFVLLVDERAKVSPELAYLRNISAETQIKLELFINSRCKLYEWTINDYFGALSTSITIDRQEFKEIHSYRIIIPGDSSSYEFHSDGNDILERICLDH